MHLSPTRYDIMYVLTSISRFMENPKHAHSLKTKRMLRHFNGTNGYDILYTTTNKFRMVVYIDHDYEIIIDDINNTSSYVFHLVLGFI